MARGVRKRRWQVEGKGKKLYIKYDSVKYKIDTRADKNKETHIYFVKKGNKKDKSG